MLHLVTAVSLTLELNGDTSTTVVIAKLAECLTGKQNCDDECRTPSLLGGFK